MQPHRGPLILTLGILSLVCCSPLGPFAWLLGNSDLKLMNTGQMDPMGRDTTNAGRICGIVGTVLLGLGCLLSMLYMGSIMALVGIAAAGGPQ